MRPEFDWAAVTASRSDLWTCHTPSGADPRGTEAVEEEEAHTVRGAEGRWVKQVTGHVTVTH